MKQAWETAALGELAKTNPLKCGEQLLARLCVESDEALVKLNRATGDEAVAAALLKAAEAYRRYIAFGHALAEATGRNIYQHRWDFQTRLNDYQTRLWRGLKRNCVPTAALPAICVEVLKRLEGTRKPAPMPRIDMTEYQSRTMKPILPSID